MNSKSSQQEFDLPAAHMQENSVNDTHKNYFKSQKTLQGLKQTKLAETFKSSIPFKLANVQNPETSQADAFVGDSGPKDNIKPQMLDELVANHDGEPNYTIDKSVSHLTDPTTHFDTEMDCSNRQIADQS